jgi:hypothetical protein
MIFITKLTKPSKLFFLVGESPPTGGFPAATRLWGRPHFSFVLQVLKVL